MKKIIFALALVLAFNLIAVTHFSVPVSSAQEEPPPEPKPEKPGE